MGFRFFLVPLVVLVAVVATAAVAFDSRGASADAGIDSEEAAFVQLINAYRAQHGLQPLGFDSKLNAAADWMSGDMAAKGYFSHTDSLGRSPGERVAAFGYGHYTGENLFMATFNAGAQVAFDKWKASPGHNANMLRAESRAIGIGRAQGAKGWYWTTDFGSQVTSGSTPKPTPKPTPIPAAVPNPSRGDVDCSGSVTSLDSLHLLRYSSKLPVNQRAGCKAIGSSVNGQVFGDADCDGGVNAADALLVLRFAAGKAVSLPFGCPGL